MEVNTDIPLEIVIVTFTTIGLTINLISLLFKVAQDFVIPKLWKYSLFMVDVGHLFLGIGLILFFSYQKTSLNTVCTFTGLFIQFGIFDSIFGYLTAGLILIFIYNPGKSSELTKFHRNVFLVIIVPQKIISIFLSTLPLVPLDYFASSNYSVTCLKIHKFGDSGTAYGIIIFCILWISIIFATAFCIISAVKLQKGFSNRVQLSSPNIWQSQLVSQGKSLQKFLILEEIIWAVVLLVTVLVIYINTDQFEGGTWIVYILLAVVTVVHSVISSIGNTMWGVCCCTKPKAVEEPHRKLKKLELVKVEGPGKLRLRALWNVNKNVSRRGMMKVYGPKHVKEWAQEIVVLGMLRRTQHPSLLQCLWTSSSNPYYETMTLITGEIITSDSRIICFELTNGGTLYEFLNRLDAALPESCQRMIIHDIAEGLYYLHDLNVLHNNLNSSCIYLKGSLPSMILRAAIGDFEETQIYGSLQQSVETNVIDKRHFFFPDIRSFALVSLEIVTKMCEKRYVNLEYNDWEGRALGSTPDSPLSQRDYARCSDFENEYEMYRRRPQNDIMSPAEIIEEVRRRSRSHSPGSRPMSAQSVKSRSRTMSPDISRRQSPAHTLEGSRGQTPDNDSVSLKNEKRHKSRSRGRSKSPKFWHRNRSKSPKTSKSQESRSGSPSQASCDGRFTPDKLESRRRPLSPLNKQTSEPQQIFDAFGSQRKNKVKKNDSKKWLSKPASLIKNLTGSETSVSVFKAKNQNGDEYDSAEEIPDEEIEWRNERIRMGKYSRTSSLNSAQFDLDHNLHRTTSSKSDQWSIRSDMVYHPHGLKNTASATSQSSLWSNLPLPLENIDIERDDLDSVIQSLPGMADNSKNRHPPSLEELLLAKQYAKMGSSSYWQQDGPGPSQFELIDYYDELQGKYVRKLVPKGLHRTLSASQIIVTPVRRTYSGTQVLHHTHSGLQEIMEATESDDPEMQRDFDESAPQQSIQNIPVQKLKVKLLKAPEKFSNKSKDSSEKTKESEKKEKKLKGKEKVQRSKSFQELGSLPKTIPEDEMIDPEVSAVKRTRARSALKRALSNKGNKPEVPLKRVERKSKENLEVKYANVKKLHLQSKPRVPELQYDGKDSEQEDISEHAQSAQKYEIEHDSEKRLSTPLLVKENTDTSIGDGKDSKPAGVKRYSSFGSNDSSSSVVSSVRLRKADVSLTSGELTSLSSQADAETDYDNHMTDNEMPKREALLKRNLQRRAKMVDSGFDSESSEISSEVHGHQGHYMSDDSAFVDNDRNTKSKNVKNTKANNIQTKGLVVTSYPSMYDTSNMFFSEKAFVLTGIHSERLSNNSKKEPNIKDEEKENSDPQEIEEDDMRPMSAMSRIIEVCSAAPEARFRDVSLDSEEMDEEEMKSKFPQLDCGHDNTAYSHSENYEDRKQSSGHVYNKHLEDSGHFEEEHVNIGQMSENFDEVNVDIRPKTPGGPLPPLAVSKKNINGPNVYASSSVASRRYRELTQKGVPLRVSVISADDENVTKKEDIEKEVEISEKEGQKLYDDLESKGFFQSANVKPKINLAGPYQTGHRSRKDAHRHKRNKAGKVSLDEIIRENPEEDNQAKIQLSPSSSHVRDISPMHNRSYSGEEAMLNQPASSEDSETNSIHTSVNNTPQHAPAPQILNQQSVVVDAELYIDRIYSHNKSSPEPKKGFIPLLDPDFDSPIGVDNKAFNPSMDLELYNGLHPLDRVQEDNNEHVEMNVDIPLLSGVSDKHINRCRKLTNHMVTFHDLLPANRKSFSSLRTKLYQKGQLGNIGGQLLDIIHKCWLNDLPPSSSELVLQLTDPVTETEL